MDPQEALWPTARGTAAGGQLWGTEEPQQQRLAVLLPVQPPICVRSPKRLFPHLHNDTISCLRRVLRGWLCKEHETLWDSQTKGFPWKSKPACFQG